MTDGIQRQAEPPLLAAAAVRTDNRKAVERLDRALFAAADHAVQLERTLDLLVMQLTEIHVCGTAARQAAEEIIQQLPLNQQTSYRPLLQAAGFADNSLAVLIENTLANAAVFDVLAPHRAIRFSHHELPGIGEGVKARAAKLHHALSRLADHLDAELGAQEVSQQASALGNRAT